MKPTVPIAIFAAVAGFSAGWLLKPSDDFQAPASQAATEDTSRGSSKVHDRRNQPLVLKPRGTPAEAPPSGPEVVAARFDFKRTLKGATERGENARLARFSEALGLSSDQQEAMAALLAGRRDGFRELSGQGKTPAEMVAEAADAERIFRQEVEKILDPEQVAALDAKLGREKENAIQASAYRALADLSSQIDLSPEQREKALASLAEASKAVHDRRPEGWAVMSESYSVLSDDQLGALEGMVDILNDPEVLKDPQALYQHQVAARRKDAEQKLAQLAGILTPAQLAHYRATLNSRLTIVEHMPPPAFKKR